MLQVGKLADYALVIVCAMIDAEDLLTTGEIIRRTSIPVATVRKLLKLLVDAAVIQSCRGNRGGYKLSQPAERTSVADVIQAIDGPIRLTKCIHDKTQNTCLIKASCPIKRQWCDLNEQIVRLLEAVSIRELAADK